MGVIRWELDKYKSSHGLDETRRICEMIINRTLTVQSQFERRCVCVWGGGEAGCVENLERDVGNGCLSRATVLVTTGGHAGPKPVYALMGSLTSSNSRPEG